MVVYSSIKELSFNVIFYTIECQLSYLKETILFQQQLKMTELHTLAHSGHLNQ